MPKSESWLGKPETQTWEVGAPEELGPSDPLEPLELRAVAHPSLVRDSTSLR